MIRQPGISFRHLLAETLGMSVSQMLDEVDSREYASWMAHNRLHPLDRAQRAELSAGIIASLIHNSQVDKDYQAKSASHFMPEWGEEYTTAAAAEMSVEQKADLIFEGMILRAEIVENRNGNR